MLIRCYEEGPTIDPGNAINSWYNEKIIMVDFSTAPKQGKVSKDTETTIKVAQLTLSDLSEDEENEFL